MSGPVIFLGSVIGFNEDVRPVAVPRTTALVTGSAQFGQLQEQSPITWFDLAIFRALLEQTRMYKFLGG